MAVSGTRQGERRQNAKVSLIIPVYNGGRYLQEAIESALAQTYTNREIIVVNDGSCDGGETESIAQSYRDRIRYFSKPNGGVASALNFAVSKMTGDYFSWLSHDDLYYPQKLERQLEILANMPDPRTVLYCNYTLIDSEGKALGDIIMDTALLNQKPLYSVLRSGINGCSLLIPREAFEKTGLFDEKLRTTQDYDLWIRMQLQGGYKFAHHPDVLVKYRTHSQQDTRINPATLPEANALWVGFLARLSDKDILSCEASRYLFLRKMAEFLERTPYVEAAAFYRTEMYKAQPFSVKKLSDMLNFSGLGRLTRRIRRFVAARISG